MSTLKALTLTRTRRASTCGTGAHSPKCSDSREGEWRSSRQRKWSLIVYDRGTPAAVAPSAAPLIYSIGSDADCLMYYSYALSARSCLALNVFCICWHRRDRAAPRVRFDLHASIPEFRATKRAAWETPGCLENRAVVLAQPANGDTGMFCLCTGPAGRVMSFYEAGGRRRRLLPDWRHARVLRAAVRRLAVCSQASRSAMNYRRGIPEAHADGPRGCWLRRARRALRQSQHQVLRGE
jgi:hypothetical protein